MGVRFAFAALALVLFSLPLLRDFTWREVWAGMSIGSCIFGGYALQTCGLQTITASKSAFITAFYVPLVPLLQWLVMKRPPHVMAWVGIALAFPGVLLAGGSDDSGAGLGRGGVGDEGGGWGMLTAVSALAHRHGRSSSSVWWPAASMPGGSPSCRCSYLNGTFTMMNAVYPHLRRPHAGTIVNVSSVAGSKIGGGLLSAPRYASSKAGVNGLTKAVAPGRRQVWRPL